MSISESPRVAEPMDARRMFGESWPLIIVCLCRRIYKCFGPGDKWQPQIKEEEGAVVRNVVRLCMCTLVFDTKPTWGHWIATVRGRKGFVKECGDEYASLRSAIDTAQDVASELLQEDLEVIE